MPCIPILVAGAVQFPLCVGAGSIKGDAGEAFRALSEGDGDVWMRNHPAMESTSCLDERFFVLSFFLSYQEGASNSERYENSGGWFRGGYGRGS